MKYIDAEKLKYEIERRKLSNYYTDTDDYETELFEIIDDLRQEQPEVDLEKEVEQVVEKYNSLANGIKVMKPSGVEKIARHFYELGKNSK